MLRRFFVLFFALIFITPVIHALTPTPSISSQQVKLDTTDLIVYQIVLDKYDGNVFETLTERLPDLAAMGVTAVQLTPIHPDGYDLKDYYDVSPAYTRQSDGTILSKEARIEQFTNYVTSAHTSGIKVLMDCVYHGTAYNSVLMSEHPEYFKRNPDGSILYNEFGQRQLDFANPAVRAYFINVTKYWIETSDFDGCRVDMAHSTPLSFWSELNSAMKQVNPSWLMIAEAYGTQNEYISVFDAGYDFFYSYSSSTSINGTNQVNVIKDAWDARPAQYRRAFFNAVDDYNSATRAAALKGGNDGMLAASALSFTLDGIPFIFNGMEIGDAQPTNATRYLWNNPPHPENKSLFTALSCMRKNSEALRKGVTTWNSTSNPNSIVSFTRTIGNEKILFVTNLSPAVWNGTVTVGGVQSSTEQFNEIVSSEMIASNPQLKKYSVINNTITMILKPYGFSVMTYPSTKAISSQCTSCAEGDSNCNGVVDLVDFESWRREFLRIVTTVSSDYNKSGTVDLIDFEMWRRGYVR